MSALPRLIAFGLALFFIGVAVLAAHDGLRRRYEILWALAFACFVVPFLVDAWVGWYS